MYDKLHHSFRGNSSLPESTSGNTLPATILNLQDVSVILEKFSSQDWSFTHANTNYLTHDLHPFPAKFIPQIPSKLISMLSMPGDTVFDPFGGSATTALEAVRLRRRAISLDISPLSALIGRVKTGFLSAETRSDLSRLRNAIEKHLRSTSAKGSQANLVPEYQNEMVPPPIPNIEKWFDRHVLKELCIIRHLIHKTTQGLALDAATLALSRIIIKVSNQDSETRYVAVKKNIWLQQTLRTYLESLDTVSQKLESAKTDVQFADCQFLVGDSRTDICEKIGENCVDLIVTSPPYPNATDYHLYHRFRLFWLGFDPRPLGNAEIGSHLRHQRNNSGIEEYRRDMKQTLEGTFEVLMPGRYAVFVVGDAQFNGKIFSSSDAICAEAQAQGFDLLGIIGRDIHRTKRSFAKPGRRARLENLVILRKPNVSTTVHIPPPNYRMWRYERQLRTKEIECLIGASASDRTPDMDLEVRLKQPELWYARRLTFAANLKLEGGLNRIQPTWQQILENGNTDPTRRKDSKYVTHGIHPFKGKFYPQLAKSLLNISSIPIGGTVFDPYCGSGTAVLEAMLNGYAAYGCDLNPLAAKIAIAKTSTLLEPRSSVEDSIVSLLSKLSDWRDLKYDSLDQFAADTRSELFRWFPIAVLHKINWLLSNIRQTDHETMINFYEVILSSLIREISHQEPRDLRIRRRKVPIQDAPVFELFKERLKAQHEKLQRYWAVAGRQPSCLVAPVIVQGDSRLVETAGKLGIGSDVVDCVITSPPYATALPYIDTDRLSLLTILGIGSRDRSDLERRITGSREIRTRAKKEAESELLSESATRNLPLNVVESIRKIFSANNMDSVGFRRANMAALLWRYFTQIKQSLDRVVDVLKVGGMAFYVVGDSRTYSGNQWIRIETCKSVVSIGQMVGLRFVDRINIDVTTENYKHIKNAITKNQIIVFEKN